ncbi:MAG: DUF4231 domain-containing protein [Anaerolineae bacterium]
MASSASTFINRLWRNGKDLFFVRRAPKWLGLSKEWDPPEDEATFQDLLQRDDFLSVKDFPEDELTKHPVIVQDMNDLRQYLVPTFYEMSQKSKYYQNMYYFYQWIFIIGAFLTTLFGTFATYTIVPTETTTVVATAAPDAAQGTSDEPTTTTTTVTSGSNTLSQVFSIITAVIGAITAFTTTLSNRHEPQKRWGNTRRLAEEMRMHYYTYVSHQTPYDGGDRLSKLRENIMKIKEQEYV